MSGSSVLHRRELVLGAALGGVAAAAPAFAQGSKAGNAESVEALKLVLEAYEKAFSAHDMPGLLKLFAPDAITIGTGAGEIWGGAAELTSAYKNFFALFDPGKQQFEPVFRDGHVLGDMAWLVSMSKVSLTKGAKTTAFDLNMSVVFEKIGGQWLIRLMHLSNVTGGQPAGK
jgi:uncharacterized protein (TIGR02246 family)